MKKLLLTTVLCVIVALCFGQKKALSFAKRELSNTTDPKIEDARKMIQGALEDPETKDNEETWFVAGKIENKIFDIEKVKELSDKSPDEVVMYGALGKIKHYFEVSDSLELLPNAKGKAKKPKFRKEMKPIMLANRLHYLNAGVYHYNKAANAVDNKKKEYQNAFDFFQQFFDIPNMKMFEGDNVAANDTAYAQFRYYAGLAFSQFGDTADVISFFEKNLKDNNGYSEIDVYKYISSLYEQTKDTVNLVRTLKEGVEKFPNESYFLLNLINQYIFSGQGDSAIDMLTKAIAITPDNAELYNVLGIVYENSKQDYEVAKANYEKAIALDPAFTEAIGNLGRIYFNRAVEAQTAANEIVDNKQYEIAKAKSNDMFREALPFFEKANQMNPDERDYLVALSRIYYVLNMGDKYDEIDKKLNQ